MPIYTVQGPDGRTYDVEGPANARPEDVLNYVRGTVGSELGKGLMRGGVGQTLVGAGGAQQAIGDAMTLDVPSVVANALGPVGIAYSSLAPLRKKFGELLSKEGDLVASAGDRVMKQFERAPALAQGNVWKDPSRLANPAWWSGGVGEGLGNLGTAYLGGRALGGASSLGKALGFAGVQAAQETAPEYRDMLASGMDKGEALARAGVMGLGSFALNYPGASAMGKESVGFLRRAAESFLKEVPTEYAEEIWQGIASGQITNLEQLKERAAAATEVLLPAAVGGVAGAGLTGRQKVAGGSPGDEAAFRDRLNGLGGLGGTAAPAMQDAGAGPIVDPNVLVPELLAQRAQQQAAQAAVERRGREGDTQLGETPNPQVPAPPVPPDPEQARLEALFARRSLGETLGAPEPSPPQAAPAAATQVPPLDFPMIDPTQGALAPEGPILQPYRPPAAPAPAVAPTGAAMAPQDAMAAAEQVRREQAALQSAITRANRQPGMAPEEVAALDAQALPERGMQPAAPEVAPLPIDSLVPAVGGRESLALAAQADQEQAAQREAERAAAWAKQPVQVRLSKDPGLKAGLERLRSEVGWYQEGGKAQIHPDTWFDLPFAEAEKMRAKAGSTSWIPRSEWWKERPVKINEKDSLEAIDRALKGEKLKPNQRKFIDYVERVYREGPAAVLRADGVREPGPSFQGAQPIEAASAGATGGVSEAAPNLESAPLPESGNPAAIALELRDGPQRTGKAKMKVDEVGRYFDRITGKRDWTDPAERARATDQAVAEVQRQLQEAQSGLGWYEEDVALAFDLTSQRIPALAGAQKQTKRRLFAVVAGILSPNTLTHFNWRIAAEAFEHYEKTGTIPGTNPANGQLWMGGTQSPIKKRALEFLTAMVHDLGEQGAVDWIYGEHSVKEINEMRVRLGGFGPGGVAGKMSDRLPGFFAFGPKVGPFVMNINGIHEVTVDKWATRTFNRYFGTITGSDGKIIDAPTEPQRRVIKEIFNAAAQRLGIKGYQVQSVLWFFEQQLYRKLGTGAESYGFSDGARLYADAGSTRGVSDARGVAPDDAGSGGVNSDNARSYGPGRRAPRSRGSEPDRAYRLAVQRLGRDARLDDLEREAEKIRREGDGIDVSYAGKKAGEAGGQLAFDFETRPETNARQRAAAEAFISDLVARRDRRLGASVLADGLTRDFTGTGTASLIGRQIASFADYGVAAQVFRDPRVEHLRFHLVKDGVVVDEIYVSSRLPGAVHFTVPDAVARLQQAMKATGATGYYIQHNHPSGNPRPSGAEEYELTSGNQSLYDMGFTETVASSVPGFEAHVVVDNDAYSVIHQKPYLNARTAEEKMRVLKNRTGLLQVTRLPVPAGVQTYHTEKNPRVPHPNLGEMFSNSTQVVEYVKRNVAPDEETVTLIATDSASKVKAIVNYPLRMLTGIDRGEMGAVARIRRLRAGAGAGFMVIAVARPKHEKALTRLMNLDLVQEAVIHEPGQMVRKVWASSASRSLKDKIRKPIGGVRSASGVFDEPAPQYRGAEAERPSRVEAGGGSYSMAQFGNLTDQELATLTGVMDRLGQKIEGERRGTRTWDATEEAALKLVQRKYGVTLDNLVERKKGSTANAEQLEAFGMMLADASKGATEAANAYARSNSAEDLARLLAAREKLGMMLAPAMGYRTEAGRALNILRKTAADFRRADELLGALGDGTENAMKDFARRLEQANGDPDKVIGLTRASYTPTLWDKFYEYWINGLLSGPLTHATNILSNAWWLTTELGAQAGATVISRDASARALAARVAGMVHGVSVGLANAGKAFLTEEPQLTPQTQLENHGPAIGGKLGKVIRIPSRALMGEDEFFKAIAYHGELASLAMDEALKDPNPKQRFNEIMGGILGRPDLIKKAREAAVRATFQDKLGPVMGNLNQALIKSKFGKLVVPFVRTPTNILKRAIEYTPAGYGMESVRQAIAAGGKDAALAYSRMSIGSGLMLGALGLAMQGLLTGAGPDDPRERQLWMRQGFQPYSVKIGNTWVRYSRIDPLATWLGIAGDMHEMAGAVGPNGLDADTLEKVGSMAVTSLALNLGDKSFLRGVSDFANAYAEPKRYLADWASGLATSVIPNAIAQPTREADPYMREARNILDTARSKIPGLRQELAAKLDIAGEPIENPGGKFVIPFNTSPQREDRLAGAMLELGVFKGKPGRRLSLRGADVELTDAQYNAYVELLQKARYSTLTPLVSSPQFQQMKAQNPLAAGELLSRTWDRIGFQGRALFLQRNPDVLLALAGAKQRKVVEPSAYAAP